MVLTNATRYPPNTPCMASSSFHMLNSGDPLGLAFHNLINGTSIKLQTKSMGESLYCITGHAKESTKNLNKCILVCPIKVFGPSFKQLRTQDLKSKIS
jgi:hypothetical protein